MGTVPAYAPSREAMGLHARGAERRKEIDSVGAALRFQLADVLHVQGTADGAERREDNLDGMVRQLAGKQEQSQSKGRRLLGRSDLAGNAIHRGIAKSELRDWQIRRLEDYGERISISQSSNPAIYQFTREDVLAHRVCTPCRSMRRPFRRSG